MSGHTKGPWVVTVAENGSERNIQTVDDWYVAVVCDEPGDGDVDANAHLIAAAPDMLEALEKSTALLRRECDALDITATYGRETIAAQIGANDAAIKKARGAL